MNPDSKSTKILRFLYLKKNKQSYKEVEKGTGVRCVTAFTKKLIANGKVRKQKIDNTTYYWVPESEMYNVRNTLIKAMQQLEDENQN